jgi:hypothetical protein
MENRREINKKSNMNDQLIEEIQRMIGDLNIPPDHIFDSHFVINMLIKKRSDAYLQFAAGVANRFNGPNLTTEVHRQIALHIDRCCERVLIAGVEAQSYSEHIHGEPCACACWMRRF